MVANFINKFTKEVITVDSSSWEDALNKACLSSDTHRIECDVAKTDASPDQIFYTYFSR